MYACCNLTFNLTTTFWSYIAGLLPYWNEEFWCILQDIPSRQTRWLIQAAWVLLLSYITALTEALTISHVSSAFSEDTESTKIFFMDSFQYQIVSFCSWWLRYDALNSGVHVCMLVMTTRGLMMTCSSLTTKWLTGARFIKWDPCSMPYTS